MARESEARVVARARRAARKLLVQALYQHQLNDTSWQDLYNQHMADPESAGADPDYFRSLLERITAGKAALDEVLARFSDIPPARLDPIEHAVLWVALAELNDRPDVPYRVAISEAVELTKRFGATDGHKYVNGVLDRAAAALRPNERRA